MKIHLYHLVTGVNSCHVARFHAINEFISEAKTGSLKIDFGKGKPKYIQEKHIDTYDIIKIGKNVLMAFSKDFDSDMATKIFIEYMLSELYEARERVDNRIEYLTKLNVKYHEELPL